MITLDLIESAQKKWGDGIVKIGSLKNDYKLCKEFTSSFLNDTYSLKEGKIFVLISTWLCPILLVEKIRFVVKMKVLQ